MMLMMMLLMMMILMFRICKTQILLNCTSCWDELVLIAGRGGQVKRHFRCIGAWIWRATPT